MPLRARDDADHDLDASRLTTAEWTALTATNRAVRHLRTHCCGAPVVLKTSRLGTRFFAHLALGGCASGDESPEHLHLKALAIAAARAAGWDAAAEVSGVTPDGAPWRADVLATRGSARIAVEVQWSPQPDDVTAARQARYALSGVRGLWLLRGGFVPHADVPAVRVRGSLAAGLTILGQPPADFFAAVFAGRLRFGFPAGSTAAATVAGGIARCWGNGCGAVARIVTGVEFRAGESVCRMAVADLAAAPALFAAVVAALPPDRARGQLRVTPGKAIVAECFACRRPLTPMRAAAGRFTAATFVLNLTPAHAAALAAQPGHAPVWSLVPLAPSARAPVAPPRHSA